MQSLFSSVIVLLSLLLPSSLLLVVVIPALMILSGYSEIIPPLFKIGGKPVQVYDFVILALIFKLYARFSMTGFQLYVQRIHRRIFLFLAVMFTATLLAFFRFGSMIFLSEMITFFRFSMMVSIFFLFFYAVTTNEELDLSERYFHMVGVAISLSVYISIVIYHILGIHFGEVQDSGGMVRYFGPLGDQVGFIIALFCFRDLVRGHTLTAVFHGAAIFATGTRGALLTLLVGLVVIFMKQRNNEIQKSRWSKIAGIVLIATLLIGFGSMMLTRFIDVEILKTGLNQRTLSMGLGIKVFLANLLTGVGYSGFRFAALGYDPESLFAAYVENVITNTSNQFIQVATDAGIPGLIAFVLMIKCCLEILKAAGDETPSSLSYTFTAGWVWLISLLIGNQSAVWMAQGSIITYLFWLLVAMAAVSADKMQYETHAVTS